MARSRKIRAAGYNLITIWESEWKEYLVKLAEVESD